MDGLTRISSDPRSEFYWKNFFRLPPKILLDGREVSEVVEADATTGVVLVIKHDAGGRPIHAGGRYLNKALTGKVEIKAQENEHG